VLSNILQSMAVRDVAGFELCQFGGHLGFERRFSGQELVQHSQLGTMSLRPGSRASEASSTYTHEVSRTRLTWERKVDRKALRNKEGKGERRLVQGSGSGLFSPYAFASWLSNRETIVSWVSVLDEM
jgi:hypothetical protein